MYTRPNYTTVFLGIDTIIHDPPSWSQEASHWNTVSFILNDVCKALQLFRILFKARSSKLTSNDESSYMWAFFAQVTPNFTRFRINYLFWRAMFGFMENGERLWITVFKFHCVMHFHYPDDNLSFLKMIVKTIWKNRHANDCWQKIVLWFSPTSDSFSN